MAEPGSAERKPEAPAARARLEDGIRDTPTAVELREAARPVAEEVDGHACEPSIQSGTTMSIW